jgi:hypothetical protein
MMTDLRHKEEVSVNWQTFVYRPRALKFSPTYGFYPWTIKRTIRKFFSESGTIISFNEQILTVLTPFSVIAFVYSLKVKVWPGDYFDLMTGTECFWQF